MLTINSRRRAVCNGLSRRDLLRIGGFGLFGASTLQLLAAENLKAATGGRAKSVLFLFLFGGPSQLESFDMKPSAPTKIRGPLTPIASRTPGLMISEKLPRTAEISDRYTVIRSMTHPHNDHNACHYIQTGHAWTRSAANGNDVNARETDWPAMGSVVEYLEQHSTESHLRDFPDYVYLPNRLGHLQGYDRTGQYAGWLGRACNGLATDIRKKNSKDNPFFRTCDDTELDFRIKGIMPESEVSLDRLDGRRGLLEQFDIARREVETAKRLQDYHGIRQQALSLVTSEKIRSALDIRREKDSLRDRYGRHLFGQSCLMGRRMVEAGCRFVTVLWDAPDGYSWDSHRTSADLEKHLLPGFDQAFAALIETTMAKGT